jgi:hypothetical protein
LKTILGLKVAPSPLGGDGVFATRDLPINTIIPYGGEALTDAQIDVWYGPGDLNLAPYAIKNRYTNRNVDSACERWIGSKINDASSEKTRRTALWRQNRGLYNALFETHQGIIRVRTTKNILSGDELFVDYGRHYWQSYRSDPPNIMSVNSTRKVRHPSRG